jgi:hypothetical protein
MLLQNIFGYIRAKNYVKMVLHAMGSRKMWLNMHSWVFQRPQIALVLLYFEVFEKLTHACYIQIALETMLFPILTAQLLQNCALIRPTISRAGPQNVMFTACSGEGPTGQQWNNHWPVNNKTGSGTRVVRVNQP